MSRTCIRRSRPPRSGCGAIIIIDCYYIIFKHTTDVYVRTRPLRTIIILCTYILWYTYCCSGEGYSEKNCTWLTLATDRYWQSSVRVRWLSSARLTYRSNTRPVYTAAHPIASADDRSEIRWIFGNGSAGVSIISRESKTKQIT